MKKRIILCVVFTVLFVLTFLFTQAILMPKYMDEIHEGALVAEYYGSDKRNDLLFIGDCEVYENISPVTLWEEYGITSYIRGSSQQLIWQSYYLLEESLEYYKPEVVVFSVLAMKYGEPQNEAYNRMTIDGMKLSASKINCARASALPDETVLSYVFPLLRFHERWNDLSADDFRYLSAGSRPKVSFNGYMMRSDVRPAGKTPTPEKLSDYRLPETSVEYLEKIHALCERNGIELVLFKAPSLFPHWYDEWDNQIVDFAESHGLLYVNALRDSEEIGVDFSRDTYDGGLHLNFDGAVKMSRYLGGMLQGGLPDRRGEADIAGLWNEKSAEYHNMRAAQLAELEQFGEIKTFLVK